MSVDTEESLAPDGPAAPAFTIIRAGQGVPHMPKKQRGADQPEFALHPAIERGLKNLAETADAGGATARTIFSTSNLHISYVWFKSGFPLPLHSHDVDCFYQIIAGSMKVGTEELGKGDALFIPAGTPYTVTPGDNGVEFFETRTSPDYDTHYRAKTDSYWDRVAETRRNRKGIWADEPPPYGLFD